MFKGQENCECQGGSRIQTRQCDARELRECYDNSDPDNMVVDDNGSRQSSKNNSTDEEHYGDEDYSKKYNGGEDNDNN